MRGGGRTALLVGAIATPLLVALIAITMLRPYRATELAIATVDEVAAAPRLVRFRELADLDDLARSRHGGTFIGSRSNGSLPVWLLRDDGRIRAYIALDPRNGCDLELWPPSMIARYAPSASGPVFHDVCHGSLYDADGRPIGGPGPFYLDELVTQVRDRVVYASTVEVHVRGWAYP